MKYCFKYLIIVVLLFQACMIVETDSLKLAEGEKVWAGVIWDGHEMPLENGYSMDFYGNNKRNQIQPLILTSKGQFIWSEQPFYFKIENEKVQINDPLNTIVFGKAGTTLAEVYRHVSQKYFPPSGNLPDEMLFTAPQYNTWIELNYNHNQEDILNYARSIIKNGLPPGVFMIDDTWQEDYGIWDFHPGRFPDPKAMVDELHDLGFKVMLWIIPFVSPDQKLLYTYLAENKALMLEKNRDSNSWETANEPVMVRWWNGVSAMLDFTNEIAVDWFEEQLERLTQEYKIDGFKFDGGDTYFFTDNMIGKKNISPNVHTELFAQFGLLYPLNEYRACWKMGGQALAQRLHDKNHDWNDLQKLIPQMLVMGISGYPFSCPDMIGGGQLSTFEDTTEIDQELIVRSAQCHALMPMMQFSVAPWRVLDEEHMKAVKDIVDLRMKYTPLIKRLAYQAAFNGEPVVRSMEYVFPGQGLENVKDQFMLGDSLLVAPVLKARQESRTVLLPEGSWLSNDGEYIAGGKIHQVKAALNKLPVYKRLPDNSTFN